LLGENITHKGLLGLLLVCVPPKGTTIIFLSTAGGAVQVVLGKIVDSLMGKTSGMKPFIGFRQNTEYVPLISYSGIDCMFSRSVQRTDHPNGITSSCPPMVRVMEVEVNSSKYVSFGKKKSGFLKSLKLKTP